MPEFAINIVAEDHGTAGKLAPRVVLMVDGDEKAVQRVNLESDIAIARTAKKWFEQFDIDEAEVVSKLQELGVEAMEEVQKRRQQRGTPPDAELRISELADEFLGTLEPQWHRKHRAIYFEGLGREVALGSLWTLANDALIDRVLDTIEAREAARDGPPPNYRARLSLLKEAVAMAGSRLVTTLPAVADVAEDNTLDHENLRDLMVAWLLAPRNFRTDTGTPITITFHSWAIALAPGVGWLQCFTASVFGRISEADGRPEIAVKAEVLKVALSYGTTRRLIGDLKASEYAEQKPIKVARCAWRVLILDRKLLDSISSKLEATPNERNP